MDGHSHDGSYSKRKDSDRTKGAQRDAGGVLGIAKILEGFGHHRDRHRVFRDSMAVMAIAISNAVDYAHRAKREATYLEIIRGYDRAEVDGFCRILAALTDTLEEGPADILGAVFGALEVQNKHAGQFFTPYEVCKLMARMLVCDGDEMRSKIERDGFVNAHEPAVGAGAMVIALAEAMLDAGINYQQHLHVTAVDVDERAAHMAYIQFSLLNIPAIVIVGNSITLEMRETWYTPAHILNGWSHKLRRRDSHGQAMPTEPEAADHPAVTTALRSPPQLVLF
jgi:hypothetical protein